MRKMKVKMKEAMVTSLGRRRAQKREGVEKKRKSEEN